MTRTIGRKTILEFEKVNKTFTNDGEKFSVLRDINLSIYENEIFGIIGLSGAGKSTLLRTVNRLEGIDSGNIYFQGENMQDFSEKELHKKRQKIGMIFQSFNLFLQRNVLENVIYPLQLAGVHRNEGRERAEYLLEIVGLKDRIKAFPATLSGGEKQRVAIARALANKPTLLLSDEATSSLDPNTTEEILELLQTLNQEFALSILLVTHQMEVVNRICNRVAVMNKGAIISVDKREESPAVQRHRDYLEAVRAKNPFIFAI